MRLNLILNIFILEYMNTIIEQIHNEASTAEQKLLLNAEQVLFESKDSNLVDRVNQLKDLGFKNFKQAKMMEPQELEKIKNLRDTIKTYRNSFDYKFMTDDAVFELCRKFGLVQSPVHLYTDSIPQKNQKEIIEFSKNESVKPFIENTFMDTLDVSSFDLKINGKKISWNFHKNFHDDTIKERKAWEPIKTILSNWESKETSEGWYTKINEGIIRSEGGKMTEKILEKYSEVIVSALKVLYKHKFIDDNDFRLFSKGEGRILNQGFEINSALVEAVSKIKEQMSSDSIELRIIAPKHMLDLSGYEIDGKLKVVPEGIKLSSPDIKEWFRDDDPIIQAKVQGGWVNVTAWGPEEHLPEIKN